LDLVAEGNFGIDLIGSRSIGDVSFQHVSTGSPAVSCVILHDESVDFNTVVLKVFHLVIVNGENLFIIGVVHTAMVVSQIYVDFVPYHSPDLAVHVEVLLFGELDGVQLCPEAQDFGDGSICNLVVEFVKLVLRLLDLFIILKMFDPLLV